jgi:hypothetical protein
MKQLFIPSLFVLFLFAACGPKMTPVEYNDTIIKEQSKILELMLQMTDQFENSLDKADSIRIQVVAQTKTSQEIVSKLPDYKGNTELRDAALALFKFYEEIHAGEFKELIDIQRKDTSITMEDLVRVEEIQKTITDKETVLDARMEKAQTDFAKEHNIQIEANKLQKEIDKL